MPQPKSRVKQLVKQVGSLSLSERREFFKEFGKYSLAGDAWDMLSGLSDEEAVQWANQYKELDFEEMMFEVTVAVAEVFEKTPGSKLQEILNEAKRKVEENERRNSVTAYFIANSILKEKRDRSSADDNVRRNVEICRQRQSGMTYGQIGKEHGISRERARQIVVRESHWKKQLRQLDRDNPDASN